MNLWLVLACLSLSGITAFLGYKLVRADTESDGPWMLGVLLGVLGCGGAVATVAAAGAGWF